jgi:hypothetical protein
MDRMRAAAEAREATGNRTMSTVDEDLARMFALPVIAPELARCPDREAYANKLYNHARPGDFILRDVQIDSAYTYETQGGLFGPQGVGHGKTIVTLLCGKVAIERRGHNRAVILVPPQVYSQLIHKDLPQARRWLSLDAVPIYVVNGGPAERMRTAQQQGPGLFIYSYSSLSAETGYEELCAMSPTCFIMDEAQCVARFTSARTRRWHSVVTALEKAIKEARLGPDVRATRVEAIILSGTITKKSVKDYAHLARVALREKSPAPIRDGCITTLASCIDAETTGGALGELDMARMRELVDWAAAAGYVPPPELVHPTFQEMVREAFQYRLRTSPAVVSKNNASADCSLIISWSEPPRPKTVESEAMASMMQAVVQDMTTPNGDVIDYGMHSFKWLWELTAGFYNCLTWPTLGEIRDTSARKGKVISGQEAEALLHQARTHHAKLQDYHKILRKFLETKHLPGCDTPMLVAAEIVKQLKGEASKHRLPPDLVQAYAAHKAEFYDDLPERSSSPVRVCDYKVRAAVEWCRAHHAAKLGGMVWYHHPEIGRWLCELLKQADIPHTFAPAGNNEAPFANGIVVSSFAHGVGKNLQHQSRNLIMELRREAAVMEQMLGRTHRSGQKADDVRADVLISNGFDLVMFNQTLRDADYIQSTTGQLQRLCYATYSPVVPPTHPRLAVRLGIIAAADIPDKAAVEAHKTITPPEALSLSDIFRSIRFAAA